jgi:phage baseplate assembly protein W
MDDVPHLALPLRIVGDRYVTVQQDTIDELVTCVGAITLFPLGYRVERPDFGVVPMEFDARPLPVLDVEQAIEAWEPRADVRVSELPFDRTDPGASRVNVEVTMPNAQESD